MAYNTPPKESQAYKFLDNLRNVWDLRRIDREQCGGCILHIGGELEFVEWHPRTAGELLAERGNQ